MKSLGLDIRPRPPRVFYGWWIVAATVAMLAFLAGSIFWSFSFFVSPMETDLGWSSNTISGVFLIQGLISALLAPVAGALFDRFGPRRVAAIGIVMCGGGLILWSRSESIWQFYLAFNFAGAGFTAVFSSTIAAVANWFIRRRGLAIGIASLGIAFAGGMAPIVLYLIETFTWRTTLLLLGVVTMAVFMPLAMVLRHRPEPYGSYPDGDPPLEAVEGAGPILEADGVSVSVALRTRSFWLMGYAFLMGFWAIGAIQVHQSQYLESVGISRGVAAAMIALLSITSVIGRVVFGWLVDRYDPRLLTAVALTLHAIGVFVFAIVDGSREWTLAVFLILFSPGLGALMVLQPAMQGHYFGRRAFGVLAGINYALTSVSWSAGPYVLGISFGVFDAYQPGLLLFGGLILAGIPALFLLGTRSQTPGLQDPAGPGPQSHAHEVGTSRTSSD